MARNDSQSSTRFDTRPRARVYIWLRVVWRGRSMRPFMNTPRTAAMCAEPGHETARHERKARAYQRLRSTFLHTLNDDVNGNVPTPAFAAVSLPLYEVVARIALRPDLADWVMPRIVEVLVAASQGHDPSVRLPANALLYAFAHSYADQHAQASSEVDDPDAPNPEEGMQHVGI